jgi:hypothetical protein
MVSRKVLDERGVFTCDTDEVREQLDEIHGMLTMLVTHPETAQEPELMLALQAVTRSILAVRQDVSDIDEVLRERGAIVDANEYLHRRRREQREEWRAAEEVQ